MLINLEFWNFFFLWWADAMFFFSCLYFLVLIYCICAWDLISSCSLKTGLWGNCRGFDGLRDIVWSGLEWKLCLCSLWVAKYFRQQDFFFCLLIGSLLYFMEKCYLCNFLNLQSLFPGLILELGEVLFRHLCRFGLAIFPKMMCFFFFVMQRFPFDWYYLHLFVSFYQLAT